MRFLVNFLIGFLKIIRPRVTASPGRVRVGLATAFTLGELREVTVNDASVLVARVGDGFCAVENRCAHLPVPLEGGRLEGDVIVCPFHNSRFDMCSGQNLDWTPGVAGVRLPRWSQRMIALGRQPQGIQAYQVVEENGVVYVDVHVSGR